MKLAITFVSCFSEIKDVCYNEKQAAYIMSVTADIIPHFQQSGG